MFDINIITEYIKHNDLNRQKFNQICEIMIFDQNSIDCIGFDHDRRRSRPVQLPVISKICLFRRITEPVSSPPNQRRRSGFNCHEEFILWIMVSGSGALLVSDTVCTLKSGEAMLVFPWQPHFRIPLPDDRADWLLVRFHADEGAALEYLRNQKCLLSKENIQLLQRLIDLWNLETVPVNCSRMAAVLLDILFSLFVDDIPLPEENFNMSVSGRPYIKELCESMMNGFPDGKLFEKIARKWSITPEYLHVVFRKYMGCSVRNFLNERKLVTAKHLLGKSDLLISDIALRVGFQSVYAFSRFFKKYSGCSPSEFRKK